MRVAHRLEFAYALRLGYKKLLDLAHVPTAQELKQEINSYFKRLTMKHASMLNFTNLPIYRRLTHAQSLKYLIRHGLSTASACWNPEYFHNFVCELLEFPVSQLRYIQCDYFRMSSFTLYVHAMVYFYYTTSIYTRIICLLI